MLPGPTTPLGLDSLETLASNPLLGVTLVANQRRQGWPSSALDMGRAGY